MPVWIRTQDPRGFSRSKSNSVQTFSVYRQLQGGIFLFAHFSFLLHFPLFLLYYNFPLFLLILCFFCSYSMPHFYLPLFFTSLYTHPTLFQLYVFMPSFFKFSTSCAVILVHTVQSVSALFHLSLYPNVLSDFVHVRFILCTSYLQFLTQYLHS